jgi:23S rRNA pseudouridine2457 synthase
MVFRNQIMHPRFKIEKAYWAQVEGVPEESALAQLRAGVMLKDGLTMPAKIELIAPPSVWERDPPIRYRAKIPTTWLEIRIKQGKNRQVRRMTAKVGYPTLRLIRFAIGHWHLGSLLPGMWRIENE